MIMHGLANFKIIIAFGKTLGFLLFYSLLTAQTLAELHICSS